MECHHFQSVENSVFLQIQDHKLINRYECSLPLVENALQNGAQEQESTFQAQKHASASKSKGILEVVGAHRLHRHSKKISKKIHFSIPNAGKGVRRTWNNDEDEKIISLVKVVGLNWTSISKHFEGTISGKQIKDRYLNHLVHRIKKPQCPEEEEKKDDANFNEELQSIDKEISGVQISEFVVHIEERLALLQKIVALSSLTREWALNVSRITQFGITEDEEKMRWISQVERIQFNLPRLRMLFSDSIGELKQLAQFMEE